MKRYKVPKNIRDVAQRAVNYNLSLPISQRAAYKDKGDKRVAGTGMRTARRLISGSVDEAQMILMRAWFARHGKSPASAQARKDRTSKASIAFDLWGGNVGKRWVNYHLSRIERARKD